MVTVVLQSKCKNLVMDVKFLPIWSCVTKIVTLMTWMMCDRSDLITFIAIVKQ